MTRRSRRVMRRLARGARGWGGTPMAALAAALTLTPVMAACRSAGEPAGTPAAQPTAPADRGDPDSPAGQAARDAENADTVTSPANAPARLPADAGLAMGPARGEPLVRVGVRVGVDSATVASPGGLRITDAGTGRVLAELASGEGWRFGAAAGLLVAAPAGAIGQSAGTTAAGSGLSSDDSVRVVSLAPVVENAPLLISGKSYRGSGEIFAVEGNRLTAVNRVPMEAYLFGVVPPEIGSRTPEEFAAVQAQAVAARTYAVAHLGSHAEMGFDVFATVADQVYEGIRFETPQASRAVRETAGLVLTWEGRPIRALYHSTCGGRTASIREVLDRPAAPYLQSIADTAPDGTAYCAISPKYRWVATWSPGMLNGPVREELARYFGVGPEMIGSLSGGVVRSRTSHGRVRRFVLAGPGAEYVLDRNTIRFILREGSGRILNSTHFQVVGTPGEGGLALRGRGYGHGVGMCQWGAIGRARAGHGFTEILQAYYPGAVLRKLY